MSAVRKWIALVPLAVLCLVAMSGCEGPAGPQGPPGDDGPEYTYMGKNGESCSHCHSGTVASVALTGHTFAYDNLASEDKSQDNPYCLQCHTTGWDSEVSYGDTEIGAYGPDMNGYDDYWGVEGDEAAERRADLEGVQCESCHGAMGPDFNTHRPDISFSDHMEGDVSTSLCYKCHHTQIDEWAESGHAMAADGDISAFRSEYYANGSSCKPCHTAEGFIAANDPAYADYEFTGGSSFIGCVACHDPHAGAMGSGNEHQLRQVGPVEVNYDPATEPGDEERPRFEGYGTAQTCAQCHKGRRDNDNVAGQIADGYDHFGPHHSAQMDMVIGAGAYLIPGKTYDATHAHQGVSQSCVDCHMVRETILHGELQDHSFHTFEPDVGNCVDCHGGWSDFSDMETFQASVDAKMDELAALFGYTDFHDMEQNWDSTAGTVEVWQREAAYAAYFVYGDGSHGVHNPHFAMDLLQNAIDYYTEMSSR